MFLSLLLCEVNVCAVNLETNVMLHGIPKYFLDFAPSGFFQEYRFNLKTTVSDG